MEAHIILISFLLYTFVLLAVSYFTGKKANNESFFRANNKSPWYIVAYGMIGASLSGVTFISIPGAVGNSAFSYLVMVIGYLFGYWVIIKILLPLYYKLNLTSIYSYLKGRFGRNAYKSGAIYFLISRVIGASFRMYLVVSVLQYFVLDHYKIPFTDTVGFPFALTVGLFILLILIYTMKAGLKTIVWTDTLQTTFMLASVVIAIYYIAEGMNIDIKSLSQLIMDSEYSKVLDTDVNSPRYFIKHFISGMFMTIVMTGLDQDMMQKNLSCKNIGEAQKNMKWMSISLLPINLLFLSLGAALFIYADFLNVSIPEKADMLFPLLAINHMGIISGVVFIIGLIAAAYSSADSALTSLTTSMSVDIFNLQDRTDITTKQKEKYRKYIHLLVSFIVFFVIVLFNEINEDSVVNDLFKAAAYTYGPLLGMFAFGLFTKHKINDKLLPIVVIISPILAYFISYFSPIWFSYNFGFEILLVNGIFTVIGLYLLKLKA